MTRQITTITFFRFKKLSAKVFGLKMMQFAHPELSNTKGQQFYRLMGSGKGNGFNPLPDWSVYCLLQVWENEVAAEDFFKTSELIKSYNSHSTERITLFMRSISSNGTWIGKSPFEKSMNLDPSLPIAIITRATIKRNWLLRFWKYVPTSEKGLIGNDGLIYTKGVGEVPIIQMATFSIWNNFEAVKKFAYQSKEHQEAIKRTRKNDWYSEELFARFHPYKSVGSWSALDRLRFD
jgi:heme-degrading monooxygenase HmoA